MTNYSFLSYLIWDMFLKKHNLVVSHDENVLFILNTKTRENLSMDFAIEADQKHDLHSFDLLVELADRLRWSSETIDLVEKLFGPKMIEDLIDLVEDIEDAQLA